MEKKQKKDRSENPMAKPKIIKIVINVGAGEAVTNKKAIESISNDLSLMTGQKPIVTNAHKAVSAFKIRMGMPIGVKVTLRGKKMKHFCEKLINIVLPRIRDFRGIAVTSIDGTGNLNIGLTDQSLFPEIDYDKIDKIRGLQVTIVTNAANRESAKKLLAEMGLPFKASN